MEVFINRSDIYRPVRCFLVSLALLTGCLFFSGCDDANKSGQTGSSKTEMLPATELPPGKPALEDETSLPVTVNPGTGMIGKEGGKTTDIVKPDLSNEALLRRKFRNLLVFHADDTMEVNNPKLATLILSKDESLGKMKLEVLEESDAGDEAIKMDTVMEFGSKMKARLIPFGNSRLENTFTIEALGDDMQSFKTDRKKIIWQWKITPLKPGKQELKLSIQIIEKDGEAVSLPARNIPVVIFARPESFVTRAASFFEKYWQFLVTAILIPIITAWVSSMIKNKGSKEKKDAPKTPSTAAPVDPTDRQHSSY